MVCLDLLSLDFFGLCLLVFATILLCSPALFHDYKVGGQLRFQTSVVLFDFVGENRGGRDEDHFDIGCLLDVLRGESWEVLLGLTPLVYLAQALVNV